MVIGTDTIPDLSCGQRPIGFTDSFLAVLPLRLDRVEPRALDRQPTDQDADPTLLLGAAVVFLEPAAYPLADVPGGVIPDQQQRRLAFGGQLLTDPAQEVLGDLADRATVHETQQHPAGIVAQQPVAT